MQPRTMASTCSSKGDGVLVPEKLASDMPRSHDTKQAEEMNSHGKQEEEYDGQDDTPEVQQAVRKVDRCLMPMLFFGFAFTFAEKTIISSAAVLGMIKDTHLTTGQYSWVSASYYWGYLCSLVTSEVVPHIPWLLPAFIVLCSIAVGCTAACTNYAGLVSCRVFLGIFESVLSPGFLFITSGFYTREETPRRVGIWWAGNSVGGLLSCIYAYGVGHITHPLSTWRWLFIILAACQFLYSVGTAFLLPLKIRHARFLTPRQKYLLQRRVEVRGTGGTTTKHWHTRQIRECLLDPKTWIAVALATACQIPVSATLNFSNIVLESFGFSKLDTTLLQIPYYFIAAISISGSGWLAGKYDGFACYIIAFVSVIPIIGSALIYVRPRTSQGVQLVGYYLLGIGPANFSLLMGLGMANIRGVTKKATFNALILVFYSAGNLIGPHLFRASQAPQYQGAFCGVMVCYAVATILTFVLRAYIVYANRQRDFAASETATVRDVTNGEPDSEKVTSVSSTTPDSAQIKFDASVEDMTDWEDTTFRYRL